MEWDHGLHSTGGKTIKGAGREGDRNTGRSLIILQGSHLWYDKPLPITDRHFGDMDSIQTVLSPDQVKAFKPVPMRLKKGQACIHHPLTGTLSSFLLLLTVCCFVLFLFLFCFCFVFVLFCFIFVLFCFIFVLFCFVLFIF